MSIRVLLVDDQAVVRAGFRTLLQLTTDMEIVGEAATGREAIDLARRHRPHVVLMDVRMPDLDGIEGRLSEPARSRDHAPCHGRVHPPPRSRPDRARTA